MFLNPLAQLPCPPTEPRRWGSHPVSLASFLFERAPQAALEAQSPYYKALIGRVLGYSPDNIAHHIRVSREGRWVAQTGWQAWPDLNGRMTGLSQPPSSLPLQEKHGAPPSSEVLAAVERQLGALSTKQPQLPWTAGARGSRKKAAA